MFHVETADAAQIRSRFQRTLTFPFKHSVFILEKIQIILQPRKEYDPVPTIFFCCCQEDDAVVVRNGEPS